MDTNFNISEAYDLIQGKLSGWMESFIQMLPNFLVAILVVLAFVVAGRLVRKGVGKLLSSVSESQALNNLIMKITYLVILSAGVFVALSILKLDKAVTSLLAGAGIIGLALGFAFQDIATNFMSGVIMAVKKPLRVGDLVETNGIFGHVEKMSLRATEIHSLQGQRFTVPNKLIFENPIQNYTQTGVRRVDLECGVSYGDDLPKVREVTIKAIEALDCIDKDKGVTLFFKEFGGSSINYQIRYWLKESTEQGAYLNALSEGIIAIKKAYDSNGIDIPFPIRTLDFGIKGGEKLSAMIQNGQMSNGKLASNPQ